MTRVLWRCKKASRISSFWLLAILSFITTNNLNAQVVYSGDGGVIGAVAQSANVQDIFKVSAGTDRLLVGFITRDGNPTVTDSITYNGLHFTKKIEQAGSKQINTEIWYLALGSGPSITSTVSANFRNTSGGSLPDVILSVAAFENVDQSQIFGSSDAQQGSGIETSTLNMNTSDANGLIIGTVSTDFQAGSLIILPIINGQTEIYETIISGDDNSSEGSYNATSGGIDSMAWKFDSTSDYVVIGVELLSTDGSDKVVQVKDPSDNVLFEINDEGSTGSITLKDTPIPPIFTANKLYSFNGELFYDGSSIGSTSSPFIQTGNLVHQNSSTFSENFVFGREVLPNNSMISDTFLFFDHNKAAFRGGLLENSNSWQPSELGSGSYAYGANLYAPSYGEMAVGVNNENYTPNSQTNYNISDRIFSIGNGASASTPSNALTVLKNGRVGIGVSVPVRALDIAGSLRLSPTQTFLQPAVFEMKHVAAFSTVKIVASEADFFGNPDNSSQITLFNSTGSASMELDAREAGQLGATISLINNDGVKSVILQGGFGTSTKGKITTDIIEIRGGSDFAEYFDVNDMEELIQPGMVVCIDDENEGELVLSQHKNDRKVIGVISGANGIDAGMVMGQDGTMAFGDYPVSLIGRVYVKCNTENGDIKPGDFLTTSSEPGEAMRVKNYNKARGAILGKALSSIDTESGFVLVFVNLQ